MMDQIPNRPDQPDIETVLELNRGGNGAWTRWRGRLIAAGVALVVIGGGAFWTLKQPANTVRYVTEQATKGDLTVIVTATGSVQPTNQVDISSELSGIIREVLVDYNSPVKVGQPLAILDTDRLQATVDSSRARVAAAEASLLEAEATVEEKRLDHIRKKQLAERKVGTERDLESARAAYDRAVAAQASAKAAVASAKADLKLDETNLAKACICSPINGVVLNRVAEPGQTVASSLQAPILFTIAEDLREMEVQVDVDEADVGKVKVGQTANFSVDAYPDRKFAARISELYLGSEVVQNVVTYKAVLTTDNNDLALRPGMTATAEIKVKEVKDALTVPNGALRFTPPVDDAQGQSTSLLSALMPGRPHFRAPSKQEQSGPSRTVWVLKDGQPTPLSVTVGATDGQRTEIVGGPLTLGQAVIIDAAKSGK